MAQVQKINPSIVAADRRAQSRSTVNREVVADYAEAMRAGVSFPAIVVFFDGTKHWLADGFHRLDAALLAEVSEIDAEVRQGDLRDAVLHSVGANGSHGLRRTNEDKRNAALTLLGDDEWSRWSNVEIAKRCAVSEGLVRSLRTERSDAAEPRSFTTKHGTASTMKVENIGRKLAEPVPPIAPSVVRQAPVPQVASPFDAVNVVSLAGRLQPIQSEADFDREADAEEAAELALEEEPYDANKLEDRALAINGALNTFDFVPMTGREYWQVYGHDPAREAFLAWALKAQATINDIVMEHENVLAERKATPRNAKAGVRLPAGR